MFVYHTHNYVDTVCFGMSEYRVREGNRAQLEVVLSKPLSSAITVQLRYNNILTTNSKSYT